MRKKSFIHVFKQECVNLVIQHKYPVTQAAETMNITFQPFNLSTFQPFNLSKLATAVSRRDPRGHTDS